mmetsp:Transcript_10891/g.21562  ORF Transcript_10891/g.21562 Transcript_10891/m.21562 type:complete len:214 (+) Transcript_10891:79-720(+)
MALAIETNLNITDTEKKKIKAGLKLVMSGDGAVGKTCFLIRCTTNYFPGEYIPTVFDNYTKPIKVDGKMMGLGLWDVGGRCDYDRLRPLSYPKTNVFLMCFSVVSESSYKNISEKWIPEIRHHAPGVPVVLCGTKSDLRSNKELLRKLEARREKVLSFEDGTALALKIGAAHYVECSALTGDGMENVEKLCTQVAYAHLTGKKKTKGSRCVVI